MIRMVRYASLVLALVMAFVGPVAAQQVDDVDSDGDGVVDTFDNCDDTPPGDLVDADGCSICPCETTADGDDWGSHRDYVRCVVDATRSRVQIGALRARAAGEHVINVDAQVADAQALPFADAKFDDAFCLFAIMFFPDRTRALTEMRRVLRPGGKALIGTWPPRERRPIIQLAFEAMIEAFPGLPLIQPEAAQDLEPRRGLGGQGPGSR